ncbi:hypothetical protein LWM68_42020 [Niabella sp. W65]|nr:hypothetical protein [Niabella sp. W65]MCH7368730.1 hypothetical protein [Niabella sp. W65]ULT44302.1 hypothetical protein KRR40_13700 [Niabella sp. I65]
MKKIYALFLAVLIYGTITAQTITVNGGCIAGPVTLTQGPALIDGKPYYIGSGTVAGVPNIQIAIQWSNRDNLWLFTFDGGGVYFTSTANTSRPPGTASTVFSWQTADPAPAHPRPLKRYGQCSPLGNLRQHRCLCKRNNLHVNWTTEKEVNNDHFEIEASADGEQFITIGNLKSKAENGNSDITLNYEWAGNASLNLAVLPYLAFVLILLLFVRRKKAMLMATVAVSFIAFTQISCKKIRIALQILRIIISVLHR